MGWPDGHTFDPWAALNSRFDGLEKRIGGVEARMTTIERDAATRDQLTADLVDAFRAFRNALYMVAGLLVVLAATVLIFGHP